MIESKIWRRWSGEQLIVAMAHQAKNEGFPHDDSAAYTAISVLFVLVTILYLRWRSVKSDVSNFPWTGRELGGFSMRRQYFVGHALELFREGHSKVPFNISLNQVISLIILSSKTPSGVSLQQMVRSLMDSQIPWFCTQFSQATCLYYRFATLTNFVTNLRMLPVVVQQTRRSMMFLVSYSLHF